ncbi:MAG: GNAT family N-acetyltransferase [Lentisphaeria bacterium]|nr:GNAT family N-acetyltransferase [Lentisphaeria bacterium]
MVDYKNSSPDWQRHSGDVLVLPLGTLEQHGKHLPLNTVTISSERIARAVAEHFQAALLPALPISNSIVHTGFRGTFSFSPETLTRMIRDLADEAERQHFRYLVIISGDSNVGLLDAVCCDINRNDRKIKLLPVYPNSFADRSALTSTRKKITDFHAGEADTSRFLDAGGMLLAQPEMDRSDITRPKIPWTPSDLAIFGIGNMNAPGYVGMPGEANGSKGRALNAGITESVIAYLESRLAMLRRSNRYAGPGGLSVRLITPLDMPELMRLVETARWNQQEKDWEFLLDTCPEGCLGVAYQGKIIGTAVALDYPNGPVWINMALVDPEFQSYSVTSDLVEDLMRRFHDRPLRLDSTPQASSIYRKLGFRPEFEIMRLVRSGGPLPPAPTGVLRAALQDLPDLAEQDAEGFICERSFVLERLMREDHDCAFKLESADGFLLSRKGLRYRQLGPVYAPDDQKAADLVAAAIRTCNGGELVIDVPKVHTEFIELLRHMGFIAQRGFLRMGKNTLVSEKKTHYYATVGPEFG